MKYFDFVLCCGRQVQKFLHQEREYRFLLRLELLE